MKRLKIILESSFFYFSLIIVCLIFVLINIFLVKKESVYTLNNKDFNCILEKYSINGNQLKMNLKCEENLIGYYYFKELKEKESFVQEFETGYRISLNGILEAQRENTNINLFDYKEYYYLKNTFFTLKIDSFKVDSKKQSLVYKIKNYLINKTKDYDSFPYINALLLGDISSIPKDVLNSYRNIGIYHIFSISGSHLSLIVLVLSQLIKKKRVLRQIVIFIVLITYYVLVGSVSMLRTIIFYSLGIVFRLLRIKKTPFRYISLGVTILLFINPYYIYNIGFLYSVVVSSFIIVFNYQNQKLSKMKKTIMISIIAFLASFPITTYNFYEINILSVCYNVILVPLVSTLLFPLVFVLLFISSIDPLVMYLIEFLENCSLFFSNINTMLIFPKIELYFYLGYYIILFLIMYKRINYVYWLVLLVFHYNYKYIFPKDYIMFLDVGQGDSILISKDNYNILIDTGGKTYFYSQGWQRREETSIINTITIPIMKSLGIRRIDKLILTHGDSDHAKEATTLIENFRIKEVYFNSNSYNKLEEEIKIKLDSKRIKYEKITMKQEDLNGLLMLSRSFTYDDENDSSIINFLIINEKKLLLTGDSSSKIEEKFLESFDVKGVDILKVGHHGSKTSTSDTFVDTIRPKIAVISVGRNNRYNHPSNDVLNILKHYNTLIYRTDINGAIIIYLN